MFDILEVDVTVMYKVIVFARLTPQLLVFLLLSRASEHQSVVSVGRPALRPTFLIETDYLIDRSIVILSCLFVWIC